MAISFTYCGETKVNQNSNYSADALYKASGARVDVADSAASSALTSNGWYRIAASTDSYVLIDAAATDGTGGEYYPAGHVEVRWVYAGDKIGVSAA